MPVGQRVCCFAGAKCTRRSKWDCKGRRVALSKVLTAKAVLYCSRCQGVFCAEDCKREHACDPNHQRFKWDEDSMRAASEQGKATERLRVRRLRSRHRAAAAASSGGARSARCGRGGSDDGTSSSGMTDVPPVGGAGGGGGHLAAVRAVHTGLGALLDAGADPSCGEESGARPRAPACQSGSEPDTSVLPSRHAAGLSSTAAGADSCTRRAAETASAVRTLLGAGGPAGAPAGVGRSPLLVAAGRDDEPGVLVLLAAKAAEDETAADGWSPLMAAAEAGDAGVTLLLLAAGADANGPGPRGLTPLLLAAERGHVCALRTLLAAGADPNLPDADGRTPLEAAACRRDVRAALLESGAVPGLLRPAAAAPARAPGPISRSAFAAVLPEGGPWPGLDGGLPAHHSTPARFASL